MNRFQRIIIYLSLAILVVGIETIQLKKFVEFQLKQVQAPINFISPKGISLYKWNLYKLLPNYNLHYRDFLILREVIQCESSWNPSAVSQGNYGLGQINALAHSKEITVKQMLNPDNNIDFTIYLYKRNGLVDWKQWSGHCWLPRLAKLGVYVK